MRTRVKICGITSVEDAHAAIEAGADALGFVLYRESPRFVERDQLAAIMRAIPPFVQRVGLWVDPEAEDVRQVLEQMPLDLLQFHGHEEASFCRGFRLPYLKALPMAAGTDVAAVAARYTDAAALLLDTYVAGLAGGTGRVFDWGLVPKRCARPLVLAGGLSADNVGEAIAVARPYAVDVSGGVERAKGSKDPAKMRAFVSAVRKADEKRF